MGALDNTFRSQQFDIPTIDLNMVKRFQQLELEQKDAMLHDINNDRNYKGPKLWRKIVIHWPNISEPLALLLICWLFWGIAISILPIEYISLDSTFMRIVYLFVGAQISGILVTFIHLPDMLGMLFWGVLYTNIGLGNFAGYEKFEAFLREMALVTIMLLAGLGIDLNSFKKVWFMILRLTFIPTIIEVVIIAVLAYFVLQMPWLWGTLLGLVITAVSPNVVVTVMLKLKEDRLGLNSGIHTLIYGMTTCNDVVAIFFFGVVLGVIFSTGSLSSQLLQGPVGIGIGLVYGYLYGLLIVYLPSKNAKYVNELRFILTLAGGTLSVIGSKAIGYPSAGALGCVMVSFIAGMKWRSNNDTSVAKTLDLLWKFLKPISFSLIGKEINFSVLEPSLVGYGVLIILVGCLFRLLASYLATYGGDLTWKERAYITISGFPKATVQASIGPIALDLARSLYSPDSVTVQLANKVLITSVLAIIITAPLGAILMIKLAPIWLKHTPPPAVQNNIEDTPAKLLSTANTSVDNLDLNEMQNRFGQQQQFNRNECTQNNIAPGHRGHKSVIETKQDYI